MKNTKRRFEMFTFYDHTGIEAHLEKMAEKGWELERITNFYWQYRRIKPKKMHFTVTYYPQASAFDPAPTEGEQTFQDFCAEAGWRLAASSAQLQVFCNERETPVPIETDATLQVETIHKSVKKGFLPSYILLLFVGLLQGILFCTRLWNDPIGVLASSTNLFTGACWTLLAFFCLVEIIGYFWWHRKAKIASKMDGSFVETRGHRRLQTAVLCILLVGAIYWLLSLGSSREMLFGILVALCLAALVILVNAVKNLLKRKNVAAGINRTVTVIASFVLSFAMMGALVFFTIQAIHHGWLEREPVESYEYKGMTWDVYHDELPLTIEDMITIDYDGYSYEWTAEESVLLAQFEATQRPKMDDLEIPDLTYTITKIKMPALYDLCLNGLLRKYTDKQVPVEFGYHFVEQDASSWYADKVYQRYSGSDSLQGYLICYSDRIVEISFDWKPTLEQIAVVAEKLKDM